ncbi:MAG: hypothetical protein R2806_25300 [Saprospiraceae bacterium]|nr:hypothetical protein [Lewinella sp.]
MVESTVFRKVVLKKKQQQTGLAARYEAFCRRQEKQTMVWYLIPLMSLPAVVMPISIMAMSYFTGFIAFIALSILLFYTNIVLTVAERPVKTRITFYLFTVLVHIVIPLAAFLLTLFS